MELDVVSNISEWTTNLEDIYQRQVPFATMMALNDTVEQLRDHHVAMMPVIFDRPTRYTLNSLRVRKAARKGDLVAGIYFKDQPGRRQHYLVPQVQGGTRPHTRFEYWLIQRGIMMSNEFAMPAAGIRLNANGNVPSGTATAILSQLAVGPDGTQWETKRSRAKAGYSRARYFVSGGNTNLKRGIWRRKSRGTIEPVFIFVSSVNYSQRYPFFEMSREKAQEFMAANFQVRMAQGIADQDRYMARKSSITS